MSGVVNILIASVGGQGGLTLSRIIAEASVIQGLSVRTGETLGMAQRFGSVLSFVRVGERVLSPIFGRGEADYLLGLELVETLRAVGYLRNSGLAIAADEYKPPVSSSLRPAPAWSKDSVARALREVLGDRLHFIPARRLAVKAGSHRAINAVLLGVLNASAQLFTHRVVEEAISRVLHGKAVEISVKAYYEGFNLYKESVGEGCRGG
uniref:Indolepyruvate oxidoreductase n=1 Tax=Thermogladius calderae TaxID=1200300 RepID=A0A7J3XY03_9CREN